MSFSTLALVEWHLEELPQTQKPFCFRLFGPLLKKGFRKGLRRQTVSETPRHPIATGAVGGPVTLAGTQSSTTCLSGPPVAQGQGNTGTICKKMKQSFSLPSSVSVSNHKCPNQKVTSRVCKNTLWGHLNQIPQSELTPRPLGKVGCARPEFVLTEFSQSRLPGTELPAQFCCGELQATESRPHKSSFPKSECTALPAAFPLQQACNRELADSRHLLSANKPCYV